MNANRPACARWLAIQLDPNSLMGSDGSAFRGEGKIIAVALQEYGAYLGDSDGGMSCLPKAPPTYRRLEAWERNAASQANWQAVFNARDDGKKHFFRLIEMGRCPAGPTGEPESA